MSKFTQFGLAGLAALALITAPAFAQSQAGTPPVQGSDNAETGTAGAPTPTEPAATETPEAPAAAGGEASDATRSGAPAGAAAPADMSGGAAPDATRPDADSGAPASDAQAGGAPAPGSPEQPSNEVGEVFELPRIGDKGTQIELIAGLCGVQMKNMSKEACTCLANQAYEELTPPQRDYLIAAVVAPPVADRMIGDGRVGLPDQQTIFAFLNRTADACATGTYNPATGAPAGEAPADATPPSGAAPDVPAPAN